MFLHCTAPAPAPTAAPASTPDPVPAPAPTAALPLDHLDPSPPQPLNIAEPGLEGEVGVWTMRHSTASSLDNLNFNAVDCRDWDLRYRLQGMGYCVMGKGDVSKK